MTSCPSLGCTRAIPHPPQHTGRRNGKLNGPGLPHFELCKCSFQIPQPGLFDICKVSSSAGLVAGALLYPRLVAGALLYPRLVAGALLYPRLVAGALLYPRLVAGALLYPRLVAGALLYPRLVAGALLYPRLALLTC